jgi:hypothetical protein
VNLNATLFAQLVVFLILAWFTMKFVWPPIMKALDERASKIADGLAAADKARSDLAHAEKKAGEELRKARESAAEFRSGAERQVAQLIDERAPKAHGSSVPRAKPPRPRPPPLRSAPAKPCASRSPCWRLPAPSASCAGKSTPRPTPSC